MHNTQLNDSSDGATWKIYLEIFVLCFLLGFTFSIAVNHSLDSSLASKSSEIQYLPGSETGLLHDAHLASNHASTTNPHSCNLKSK